MADLRINGWSDESLKCQPDLEGEESILVSEHRGLWDQALCPF